ncbi:nucleotidyl transferase AbiEii/AbiGii toxin family protein [Bacillus mojavensis]|uniref:nucleotidyl transferase AbiEii/AbiGii toxin family protein n=1 Tax=Bacillus mojavensis TaxID=72360 RepID=UPI002DBB10BF|nr:nucleotidyl transferase AbiEii/AbiGii toxin family protein [Bacillus mojavensis]MEC1756019.1 nucleotidyl transferase AbiEii/AbiGii toxin family protein [Bacillus mojavensis]
MSINTALEKVRETTITSLFSDDELMDILVLKGGNALELAYKLNSRASMDIDVSMEKDFADFELTVEDVLKKLEKRLEENFKEAGYKVFDVKLLEQPKQRKHTVEHLNWGGYKAEFKVIPWTDYERIGDDIDKLRRESMVVAGNKKVVKIDISKYEFTAPSEETEFKDYVIKVYSPRMIIFEKLRAICQQMEEYTRIVKSSQTPRPRDFFDIYVIKEQLEPNLDLTSEENLNMIKEFFKVKHVPLHLLNKIKDPEIKDFHGSEYSSLESTVKETDKLMEFDFYYNYVVELVQKIESLWIQESSSVG